MSLTNHDLDCIVLNNFDFGIIYEMDDDLETVETTKFQMMSKIFFDDFIGGQKAKTTKYKDTSDYNTFKRFCHFETEKIN